MSSTHRAAALALALATLAPATGTADERTWPPPERVCRPAPDGDGEIVDPLVLIRFAIDSSGLGDRAIDTDGDGDTLLAEKQLALVDPDHCAEADGRCDAGDRAAQQAIHERLATFVRQAGREAYRFLRLRHPSEEERAAEPVLARRFEVEDQVFQLGEVLAVPARFVRIVCREEALRVAEAAEDEPDWRLAGMPVKTGFRLAGELGDLSADRAELRGVRPAELSISGDLTEGSTQYHVNLFGGYEVALGEEDGTFYSLIPFTQYEEKFDGSDVAIDKLGLGAVLLSTLVTEELGRDEFAFTPYFLTDRRAGKEILTAQLRATPSLPERHGVPLGYFADYGGLLVRLGLDVLVEGGNVFSIDEPDGPLRPGKFLRFGGRPSVRIGGAEGTLFERFDLEIAVKYLYGPLGPLEHFSRLEGAIAYSLPGTDNYRLSLSYESGRVDDTLQHKAFWRTTLGVRF